MFQYFFRPSPNGAPPLLEVHVRYKHMYLIEVHNQPDEANCQITGRPKPKKKYIWLNHLWPNQTYTPRPGKTPPYKRTCMLGGGGLWECRGRGTDAGGCTWRTT